MLSCSGQSAVVVSGVTTYQSSLSAVWREGVAAVYQTGRLMEWCACPRVWADEGEGEREAAG